MDQHTARPSAGPAPAGQATAGVYQPLGPALTPAGRALAAVHRLRAVPRPRPRLTGLGAGLLTTVVTVLAGALDAWLLDGPGVFFGLVFVLASMTAAVYVRPYDLMAAPVAAPIAFSIGIAFTADGGSGGLLGHLLGVFTGLATLTAWLYTGTVLAALIAGIRALRLPSRRRRSRRCSAAPRERSAR